MFLLFKTLKNIISDISILMSKYLVKIKIFNNDISFKDLHVLDKEQLNNIKKIDVKLYCNCGYNCLTCMCGGYLRAKYHSHIKIGKIDTDTSKFIRKIHTTVMSILLVIWMNRVKYLF